MKTERILTLIPARGGSKGVLKKNIRPVAGKPLIAWSIETAMAAGEVEKVFVSTDDEEIAEVARQYGAIALERPGEIASDKSPMIDVITHALTLLDASGEIYDYLLLLQPTSPARNTADISAACHALRQSGADSLISVFSDPDKHPSRSYTISDQRLVPYAAEPKGSLRQDLTPVYHRNGAIYLSRIDFIRRSGKLWSDAPLAFVMPKERSLNIDDELDLLIADLLIGYWQRKGHCG